MTSLTIKGEPRVRSVTFTEAYLKIILQDGRHLLVPLRWYPRLAFGTPAERKSFEIWQDGQVMAWDILDEHISIQALLAGQRSGESERSFDNWTEAIIAFRKENISPPWMKTHPLAE